MVGEVSPIVRTTRMKLEKDTQPSHPYHFPTPCRKAEDSDTAWAPVFSGWEPRTSTPIKLVILEKKLRNCVGDTRKVKNKFGD